MKTICLMGPTATGKTALAVALRQRFPCEIVSVDSAMIYRGMNIGTAKPSATLLAEAPHRLIDIRDPVDTYSVGQFCIDAHREIAAIHQQGRIPLLVGGTLLYFYRFQQGLASLPAADARVRAELEEEAHHQGWPALHQRLQTIDPLLAKKIHPQDGKRIQRALEVYLLTGKSLSEQLSLTSKKKSGMQNLNLMLTVSDRATLHGRVAKRFHEMLRDGLVDEVASLMQHQGLTANTPTMQAIGYKQIVKYLTREINVTEMEAQAVAATRQLVKRQLTWCRRWETAERLAYESPHVLDDAIERIKSFIDD